MTNIFTQFAASCTNGNFFGFPSWHRYLEKDEAKSALTGQCEVKFDLMKGGQFNGGDALLVGLSVIDILIRIAGLVAVGYVIYGGIKYITSQGSPENTKNAQNTILHACIGVAIAVMASAVVAFIGTALITP